MDADLSDRGRHQSGFRIAGPRFRAWLVAAGVEARGRLSGRDMTITVEAGITIDALATTLAKERQRLPIDLPDAHRATLGGVIATNTSGARRFANGTLRDYVIGITAVDGRARCFTAAAEW